MALHNSGIGVWRHDNSSYGLVVMSPSANLPRCVMPFWTHAHAFSLYEPILEYYKFGPREYTPVKYESKCDGHTINLKFWFGKYQPFWLSFNVLNHGRWTTNHQFDAIYLQLIDLHGMLIDLSCNAVPIFLRYGHYWATHISHTVDFVSSRALFST